MNNNTNLKDFSCWTVVTHVRLWVTFSPKKKIMPFYKPVYPNVPSPNWYLSANTVFVLIRSQPEESKWVGVIAIFFVWNWFSWTQHKLFFTAFLWLTVKYGKSFLYLLNKKKIIFIESNQTNEKTLKEEKFSESFCLIYHELSRAKWLRRCSPTPNETTRCF